MDNPNVITADTNCRIVGYALDQQGLGLLRHNCAATHGVSGAPVLMRGEAGWGIESNIARSKTEPIGIAALAAEPRKHLRRVSLY